MSKRIIVTGATSFVGAAVVRELLLRGEQVAAIVRPGSAKTGMLTAGNEQALLEKRLLLVENDLFCPEGLPEKLAEIWPADGAGSRGILADAFCHFGWGGSGSGARTDRDLQEKNVRMTLETIKAARALGCSRFLFSGSQAEYGLHTEQTTEEMACMPRSAYGEAKLAVRERGAALAEELGLDYLHARIFSVYGPGDHPWTLTESCLDAFLSGKELSLGACTQLWNFLYITDLAGELAALLRMPAKTEADRNPVFNIAGSETRPLREFVEEIEALCGAHGLCRFGTRPENAEGLVHLNPSIEKLRRVTGYVPTVGFSEGIRRMLAARTALQA